MENNKEIEIQTPKNKVRSLGLRRSIQRNTIIKTPLSDVKISYKSLQSEHEAEVSSSSPFTPRLKTQTLVTSACTTNCLPYRLSLSSRVRDKYKKKKLQFAVNHSEADSEIPSDLNHAIVKKEKILEQHEKHFKKVEELKNLIKIWTVAFKASLEELSSKIEPKMETENLITRLGIPSEMINFT